MRLLTILVFFDIKLTRSGFPRNITQQKHKKLVTVLAKKFQQMFDRVLNPNQPEFL